MSDSLTALTEAGVSIWLDDLSRQRLIDGNLARLVHDQHVSGVTTNPTIFARAITGSDHYTDQIRRLALRQVDVDTALRELTTFDCCARSTTPPTAWTGGIENLHDLRRRSRCPFRGRRDARSLSITRMARCRHAIGARTGP
ncbi:transaldolase family protein [Nocardia miyunensis]|uniref:transaldolase family protein n=1 Tax=Nocardia miyunensis TaxID=282684 RepID=UPI000ACAA225|nr:transaldolase family protein [Nocardia miyunensis]